MSNSRRRLFIVRHAETYSNRYNDDALKFAPQGRSVHSLTDAGRAQANALAARLKNASIAVVFCSSAVRCQQTLEPFLSTGLILAQSVKICDELLEIRSDFQLLVDHLQDEPPSFSPVQVDKKHYEGRSQPESGEEYLNRIRIILSKILAESLGNTLVLAHHGTNNTIMKLLLPTSKWAFRNQENTCVNELELASSGEFQAVKLNCVEHLVTSRNGK